MRLTTQRLASGIAQTVPAAKGMPLRTVSLSATLSRSSFKRCLSFTIGLSITPSGYRIPWQILHYNKEYCAEKCLPHRTTADLIRSLPLPQEADVAVLGDTADDARVMHEACADRNYIWIAPANPERVYEGPRGQRPQVRSRLKDWTSLSLKTIRL